MEDRRLVPGGPCNRFIGHEAGWGCNDRRQDRFQRDPLIGAAGTRRGRRDRQGGAAARAAGARTRPGCPRTGLARPLLTPIVREQGGRAHDQVVEPVEIELPVGSRGHQVVAAGPRRPRRAEAVDQEQHECSRSPPQQPLEADGPDQDPASVNSHRSEGIATLAARAYPTASPRFKTVTTNNAGSLVKKKGQPRKTRNHTKNTKIRTRYRDLPSRVGSLSCDFVFFVVAFLRFFEPWFRGFQPIYPSPLSRSRIMVSSSGA
jgi:hypothetical protein